MNKFMRNFCGDPYQDTDEYAPLDYQSAESKPVEKVTDPVPVEAKPETKAKPEPAAKAAPAPAKDEPVDFVKEVLPGWTPEPKPAEVKPEPKCEAKPVEVKPEPKPVKKAAAPVPTPVKEEVKEVKSKAEPKPKSVPADDRTPINVCISISE